MAYPVSAESESYTTFYFVRHAEKQDGQGDVALSTTGLERAQDLLDVLKDVPLSGVYSTDFRRTQQTARPTASHFGLAVVAYDHRRTDRRKWLEEVHQKHRGENILVVGHSNTVPEQVQSLTGQSVPGIEHNEFDTMYIVRMPHDSSSLIKLERHRYGNLEETGLFHFEDDIFEPHDLSAVTKDGDRIILASDEGAKLSFLTGIAEREFASSGRLSLPQSGELDAEGLAQDENFVYAVGSHSKKRRKVSLTAPKSHSRSYDKNLERMTNQGIRPEFLRYFVYRMPKTQGPIPSDPTVQRFSLTSVLKENSTLSPFFELPSKENGIDIEGLAAHGGNLYLGFRSPVFRGGFVPVLRSDTRDTSDSQLYFLPLLGRGIRSLCRVSDGFLLIAGPSGEGHEGFRLYHWDGLDCLPGARAEGQSEMGTVTLLGNIPSPAPMKAEGLEVLNETEDTYEILVVYDGVKNGRPSTFKVNKARLQSVQSTNILSPKL